MIRGDFNNKKCKMLIFTKLCGEGVVGIRERFEARFSRKTGVGRGVRQSGKLPDLIGFLVWKASLSC
jgi:hypothetical protein